MTRQRTGTRRRRGRGGPAGASPAARELLLDAAEGLFARKGFGPTTIKEIGAAARLNPALLYYYFRSKAELYRAVLGRIVEGLVREGRARVDAAGTPEDAIRGLIEAQTRYLMAHPNAPKLFAREMVDHEARRGEQVFLQLAAGLFERLCGVIEAGQQAGRFRKDIEPRFAAISTIAQVVYFFIARPAIGLFYGLGTAGVTDAMARDFGRHAAAFALASLRTGPATAAGPGRALRQSGAKS